MRLEAILGAEVILVTGAYKSGTSLAVELLTTYGYEDLSRISNPHERGYGRSVARYLTRECKRVRRLNDRLLAVASDQGAMNEIVRFLKDFGRPTVIKDPRFVLCLRTWVEAARVADKSISVLFTGRDARSLESAWAHAPFTRQLLASGQLVLWQMREQEQQDWCRLNNVPFLRCEKQELAAYCNEHEQDHLL